MLHVHGISDKAMRHQRHWSSHPLLPVRITVDCSTAEADGSMNQSHVSSACIDCIRTVCSASPLTSPPQLPTPEAAAWSPDMEDDSVKNGDSERDGLTERSGNVNGFRSDQSNGCKESAPEEQYGTTSKGDADRLGEMRGESAVAVNSIEKSRREKDSKHGYRVFRPVHQELC